MSSFKEKTTDYISDHREGSYEFLTRVYKKGKRTFKTAIALMGYRIFSIPDKMYRVTVSLMIISLCTVQGDCAETRKLYDSELNILRN